MEIETNTEYIQPITSERQLTIAAIYLLLKQQLNAYDIQMIYENE